MISPSYDEMQRAAQNRVNMMKARADKYISMTNSKMSQGGDDRQGYERMEINAKPVEQLEKAHAKVGDSKGGEGCPLNFLQEFLQNDRLIILAVISALWNEGSDRLLMLALLYIML